MANKIHDCEREKCEGRGLDGLFFTCNRCEKKSFLECLIQESEILVLLKSLQIVKVEDGNASNTITSDSKTSFNTITNTKSQIEFVCKKCKQKGNTANVIKTMKTESDKTKKNNR